MKTLRLHFKRKNILIGIMISALIFSASIYIYSSSPDISKTDSSSGWTRMNNLLSFQGRSGHSTVVFREKLWLIGGFDGRNVNNEIYYTKDGIRWTGTKRGRRFRGRALFAALVFKEKLWIIGGLYFDREKNIQDLNDIWNSSDGINWRRVTRSAPFSPRGGHSAFVFRGKIWILGGIGDSPDIWNSADGIHWKQVAEMAPYGSRGGQSVVFFQNRLWLIGGFYVDSENRFHSLSDVWCSDNGREWKQTAAGTSFFAGGGHTAVSFKNRIVVIGGFMKSGMVSVSEDGINWGRIYFDETFGERVAHSASVFHNKLYIIGGYNGSDHKNDVWYTF
jgi:leucine-zipper-like transcriptional regulator 1